MDHLLPTATSAEIRANAPQVAVLPIGSFEQHGPAHALTTDTAIACAIAQRIAVDYGLFLLPPITFSCSHEHAQFAGTVSLRASTLTMVIDDIQTSLRQSGIGSLVLVNGHGGNYVLQNIVQQANVQRPSMGLFPSRADWDTARRQSEMETNAHEDMHAGELETSILLHAAPELLRESYRLEDWRADDRPDLLVTGVGAYTPSGVIGFPSLGTADKGAKALSALSGVFKAHLAALGTQQR